MNGQSAPAAAPARKKGLVKKVLVGLCVVLILFFGFVAMQPPDFQITRSAKINAPASAVYPLVNDFHNWTKWSPWEGLDPAMKRTYEGPPEGKDSTYHWIGNSEVGEGVMKIIENRPNEMVKIDLEFIKPFAAKNLTEFTFQPDGNETNVTWTMTGQKNFMMKAVHLFMNMDKLVGADFEKGLAQLNAAATGGPTAETPPADAKNAVDSPVK